MNHNNFFTGIIKAALITGCFFVCGCENSPEAFKALNSRGTGVEEAKGVDIIYSLGAKTKAKLTAPQHQMVYNYIVSVKK